MFHGVKGRGLGIENGGKCGSRETVPWKRQITDISSISIFSQKLVKLTPESGEGKLFEFGFPGSRVYVEGGAVNYFIKFGREESANEDTEEFPMEFIPHTEACDLCSQVNEHHRNGVKSFLLRLEPTAVLVGTQVRT